MIFIQHLAELRESSPGPAMSVKADFSESALSASCPEVSLTTTGQSLKPSTFEEYFTLYWKQIGIRLACAFGPDLL